MGLTAPVASELALHVSQFTPTPSPSRRSALSLSAAALLNTRLLLSGTLTGVGVLGLLCLSIAVLVTSPRLALALTSTDGPAVSLFASLSALVDATGDTGSSSLSPLLRGAAAFPVNTLAFVFCVMAATGLYIQREILTVASQSVLRALNQRHTGRGRHPHAALLTSAHCGTATLSVLHLSFSALACVFVVFAESGLVADAAICLITEKTTPGACASITFLSTSLSYTFLAGLAFAAAVALTLAFGFLTSRPSPVAIVASSSMRVPLSTDALPFTTPAAAADLLLAAMIALSAPSDSALGRVSPTHLARFAAVTNTMRGCPPGMVLTVLAHNVSQAVIKATARAKVLAPQPEQDPDALHRVVASILRTKRFPFPSCPERVAVDFTVSIVDEVLADTAGPEPQRAQGTRLRSQASAPTSPSEQLLARRKAFIVDPALVA
jgi:hypothetical protein